MSSKVVDFDTNRKRVCNFLLVINSDLGPILPRFKDIAGFLLRTATPHLFHPNFSSSFFTRRSHNVGNLTQGEQKGELKRAFDWCQNHRPIIIA